MLYTEMIDAPWFVKTSEIHKFVKKLTVKEKNI